MARKSRIATIIGYHSSKNLRQIFFWERFRKSKNEPCLSAGFLSLHLIAFITKQFLFYTVADIFITSKSDSEDERIEFDNLAKRAFYFGTLDSSIPKKRFPVIFFRSI